MVDRDLHHSQMAEQLVEVPQFEQFASLLAEQIVDIPVPGGSLHDYLPDPRFAALSAVSRDEPGTRVFFALFTDFKKVRSPPRSSARVHGHSSSWTPAACEAEEAVHSGFKYKYLEYNDV